MKHWNRLPREAVESPSLRTSEVSLDRALSSLVESKLPLPSVRQGGMTRDTLNGL